MERDALEIFGSNAWVLDPDHGFESGVWIGNWKTLKAQKSLVWAGLAETFREQQGHERQRGNESRKESENQRAVWEILLAELRKEAASGKVLLIMDELEGEPGREEFALHQGTLTTVTAFTPTFETVERNAKLRAGCQRERGTHSRLRAKVRSQHAGRRRERGKQPSCASRERHLASKKTHHGGAQEKQPAEDGCVTVVFALEKAAATVPQREREQEGASRSRRTMTICFTGTDEQDLAFVRCIQKEVPAANGAGIPVLVGSERTRWVSGSEKFLTQRVCRAVLLGILDLRESRGQQSLVQRGVMQACPLRGCSTPRTPKSRGSHAKAFPVTSFVKEKDRVITTWGFDGGLLLTLENDEPARKNYADCPGV